MISPLHSICIITNCWSGFLSSQCLQCLECWSSYDHRRPCLCHRSHGTLICDDYMVSHLDTFIPKFTKRGWLSLLFTQNRKKKTLWNVCAILVKFLITEIQSHIHLIEKSYFLEPAELRVSKIVSWKCIIHSCQHNSWFPLPHFLQLVFRSSLFKDIICGIDIYQHQDHVLSLV